MEEDNKIKSKYTEIIRNIKLYNLGIGYETDYIKILNNLKSLKEFKEIYTDLIFYVNSKSEILMAYEQGIEDDIYYIHKEIWSFFHKNYSLDYNAIQKITQCYIENVYNLNNITTKRCEKFPTLLHI